MNQASLRPWSVEIRTEGRSGSITDRVAGDALHLHWEFGGGEVVALVWAGPRD